MAPITPTRVLSHGGGRYTTTSVHAVPQTLLPGTYGVNFDPLAGYNLTTLTDLQAPSYRVYGRRDKTIAKVLRTYGHLTRSLGVLFEGDKGIGKSSTTVELARQARDAFGLPVIMVNHDTPNLSDFLATLGEAVVVFDEFEKNFPRSRNDGDSQAQFLTLFDGTDATKRLYIVTVNDTTKLSPYFLNRPGRFHYLISFDYPDAEAVREYITNEAPGASAEQVTDAVFFALRARLNYDHLRAIVTELTIAGPGEKVSDLVADLNLRDTEERSYDVTAHLADGTTLIVADTEVEMFMDGTEEIRFTLPREKGQSDVPALQVEFVPTDTTFDQRTGALTLDGSLLRGQRVCIPPRESSYPPEIVEDWERTLFDQVEGRNRWATFDLDDAPTDKFEYLRVQRLEFSPVRNIKYRFFA